MTRAQELVRLHARLVLDDQSALTVIGLNRIRRTPAGTAWLRDYHRYVALYLRMTRNGPKPSPILAKHFGVRSEPEDDHQTQDHLTSSQ